MNKDATVATRSLSEQEWRPRHGLSPRIERGGFSLLRLRRMWGNWRLRLTFPELRRLPARTRHGLLLKGGMVLVMATWLLGSITLVGQMGDADGWLSDRYASFTRYFRGQATFVSNARPFDDMASDFAKASEVSLIALRGYVLAGNPGFREEWRQATGKRKALEAEIERNAYLWTDGERLVQLRNLRMSMDSLAENEKLVASLVGTSNRFPGLRLYNEDVQPALVRAIELCNDSIQSFLVSDKSNAAIGALAELRGNIRLAEEGLSTFLHSGLSAPPPELSQSLRQIRKAPAALDRIGGSAGDPRLDRLVDMLRKASLQIDDIIALKRTERWDYADYAFRQKVLPETEQILFVVKNWRSSAG
ncbi:hypothetical protein [Parvibaculum sp.]|uniref:hypothetical protein n=1 Tax=Parvibaculum sp. TaxID=2024848 RepID=UPI001D9C67E5|nr:hypothetical protein [Parvibaculum sp.]MBX3489536.1 hypothetical protein [Parvibaculum sp.]MCW5726508.1 hypothetical protein [Parvibaculum sp.]